MQSAKQKDIDFIDIGCASSKPGFDSVTTEEEIERLNYFINSNQETFTFSIDSFNPIVVQHAVENNFEIINDVSGFLNEEMIQIAVDSKLKIILVHRHPKSESLHQKMIYKDVVKEVKEHLNSKIKSLISLGVKEEQIAIDPGLGFGKNLSDSAELLINIKELKENFPLIVGYSKKKFIKNIPMSNSDLFKHCVDSGVSLVRMHLTN